MFIYISVNRTRYVYICAYVHVYVCNWRRYNPVIYLRTHIIHVCANYKRVNVIGNNPLKFAAMFAVTKKVIVNPLSSTIAINKDCQCGYKNVVFMVVVVAVLVSSINHELASLFSIVITIYYLFITNTV